MKENTVRGWKSEVPFLILEGCIFDLHVPRSPGRVNCSCGESDSRVSGLERTCEKTEG